MVDSPGTDTFVIRSRCYKEELIRVSKSFRLALTCLSPFAT